MFGVPFEFTLMLGYAISLALIALLLELVARHAHRRSLNSSTIGFTYHPERDIWRCPEDQHLFPIFADTAGGRVVYRAPASACNVCRSKRACTDSDHGRTIERKRDGGLQYGMQRFYRAMSLTLLALACLILIVEFFRVSGVYPKSVVVVVVTSLCAVIVRLSRELSSEAAPSRDHLSAGHASRS